MLQLFRIFFFLLIPAIALPIMPEIPPPLGYPMLRYDEVLDWIQTIEEADLEEWTSEEIERSACFLALLAERGTVQSDFIALAVLNEDIQGLFSDVRGLNLYAVESAVWKGKTDALLCKGWFHKQSHNLKKFVKKHKTALIIGAAVIVAATVAIVAIAALSATTAATSAAAAAGAAIAGDDGSYHPSPGPIEPSHNVLQMVEQIHPILESPALAKIVEEKTAPLVETLTQEALFDQPIVPKCSPFVEKARDVGAWAAHEILDGVSTLVSDIPHSLDVIGDIGSKFLPESGCSVDIDDDSVSCSERFQETILALHEKIDEAFSTDQTGKYTPEAKAAQSQITLGILPPPLALGKGGWKILSIQEFKCAEDFLAPLAKDYIPEIYAKQLIEQFGIPTFPRPAGIPDNFLVKLSKGGAGIRYLHPENTQTVVRVMPGKPHSPNVCQQNPYVVQMIDGKILDKFGSPVLKSSPEAHIPLDEFVFRN